jgi:hypothetical protein
LPLRAVDNYMKILLFISFHVAEVCLDRL